MARLERLPRDLEIELAAAMFANAKQMQVECVALVPVDSGNLRDTLARPEALLTEKREFGPYVQFGLRTKQLRKRGWYALFVENGTKGYTKGDKRRAGIRKGGQAKWHFVSRTKPQNPQRFEYRTVTLTNGGEGLQRRLIDRTRYQKITRNVPPRPAQPFLRPSFERFKERMAAARSEIAAKAATRAGLKSAA